MGRRKSKPTESLRPPPKEQVVQIIVSSEDASSASPGQVVSADNGRTADSDGKNAISLSVIGPLGSETPDGSGKTGSTGRERSRKATVPMILPPNEVIVTEERGRTKTVVKSNYQTRRKSGVLKPTAKTAEISFENVQEEEISEGQHHKVEDEPPLKRKKGRPRKLPLVKAEASLDDGEPLLRVNGIDCSQAMDPDSVEKSVPIHDDMRLNRKLHVLLADANATGATEPDREATLKAKILLEQIANYKAKACKFSVETAIEYMKWFELSSKSYEFVRTMHGGVGLFTLPSAKTIRRYVDPFSESVQLTNLEAAHSTLLLQQMQHVELPLDHQSPSMENVSGDVVQEAGVFYVEDATAGDSDFLVRIDAAPGEAQIVSRTPGLGLAPDGSESGEHGSEPTRGEATEEDPQELENVDK